MSKRKIDPSNVFGSDAFMERFLDESLPELAKKYLDRVRPRVVPGQGSEADALLDFIAQEGLSVQPFDIHTGGDDYDTGWRISRHDEAVSGGTVIVNIQYSDDLRKALRAAKERIEQLDTNVRREPTQAAESPAGGGTDDVLIFSGEHGCYWRAQSKGFTQAVHEAGRYTRAEAESILASVGAEKRLQILPAPPAQKTVPTPEDSGSQQDLEPHP